MVSINDFVQEKYFNSNYKTASNGDNETLQDYKYQNVTNFAATKPSKPVNGLIDFLLAKYEHIALNLK